VWENSCFIGSPHRHLCPRNVAGASPKREPQKRKEASDLSPFNGVLPMLAQRNAKQDKRALAFVKLLQQAGAKE